MWLESSDPSYILYTSGTTGKPKGVQRDTGGYAVALAYSMQSIFCVEPGETFFCTSDIGWVVGHSYIVYAPLLNGSTTIMYEGLPIRPDPGIWWKIVADHGVKTMFSSPTAIRVLKKQDTAYMRAHDTSSLKRLFLAGEPLDEPTARWVTDALGGTSIIDNYWQTETGWPILSAQPGIEDTPRKFGSPSFPVTGYDVALLHEATGEEVGVGEKGVLTIVPPLPPGCMSTIWGDDARFVSTYFSTFPEKLVYSTFDWATRDADGYYFVLGRTDDVINVAGHRLGTREIEEAVQAHAGIAEVAVVGVADQLKGQVPLAFAVAKDPGQDGNAGTAGGVREGGDGRGRQGTGGDRPAGARPLCHRTAQDALGQAAAALDPGAGRRARSGRPDDDRRSGCTGADPVGACRRRLTQPSAGAFRGERVRTAGAGGVESRLCQPVRSMLESPHHVPLAVLTRGGITESVHYGTVAVTDAAGNLLHSAGDPHAPMFTRSSLKPFQAMPVLASGADRAHGFSGPELALMCASHSGEPRHVDVVTGMLRRIGCGEADLQCGKHVPYFYQYLDRTPEPGAAFSALHHNCSGKHSGMLAYCRHCGHDTGHYLDPQHPVQQAIRRSVAHFTGTPERELIMGIDGCSAPNYALPLSGLARAFAKLGAAGDDVEYGNAPARLFAAMSAHPELVSGERRNDLALMQAGNGDWATKVGAEGVQGIAVRSRGARPAGC